MKNFRNLKVILAEDDEDYLKNYTYSLQNAGFEVYSTRNGAGIIGLLSDRPKNLFQVIVSDTDLDNESDGPDSIGLAIQEKLVDWNNTLIVGMSSIRNSEDYWKGIAHAYCFYVKDCISDLGFRVKTDLDNFTKDTLGIYRRQL